jgi:hypothetical protein
MFDSFNRHEVRAKKRGLWANSGSQAFSAGFQTLSEFLDAIWENLVLEARLLSEKLEGHFVDTPYLFSIVLRRTVSCRYEM